MRPISVVEWRNVYDIIELTNKVWCPTCRKMVLDKEILLPTPLCCGSRMLDWNGMNEMEGPLICNTGFMYHHFETEDGL